MNCPNEELIDAFVSGKAEPDGRREIERHVDACSACSGVVTRLLSRTGEQLATTVGVGLRKARPSIVLREGDKFGRYIVLRELGAGGMGRVYAAYDPGLDRKVALKLVAEGSSDVAVARLLAEASVMAKLNHPNVVTVFDASVVDGEAFIAMELVEGQTLAEWREAQPRSAREIMMRMGAAARGLAAAHAAGIVHRDVKPQNVLVDGDRVLVTDFGLSVTAGGGIRGVVGTPGYMAPEQFTGAPVDERTDVFAFCASLYQLLFGALPFSGRTLKEIEALVLRGEVTPPPPGKVPAKVRALMLRGLARDPEARPRGLDVFADVLLEDPAARRRWWFRAGAASVLGFAAFVGGIYLAGSPARRCHANADDIDQTWNSEKRSILEARYVSAGESQSWGILARRLDEFAAAWRGMYHETCAASHSGGRQSESMLDIRTVCLDARRTGIEAFFSRLSSASKRELIGAVSAKFPELGDCLPTGRTGQRGLPSESTQRAAVVALEKRMAQAETDFNLGRYEAAEPVINEVLASARKSEYEPLVARALAAAALLASSRGAERQPDGKEDAVSLYRAALAAADRSGDDFVRAKVMRRLMVKSVMAYQFEEAEQWRQWTAAALERIGNPAQEKAMFETYVGVLKAFRGDKDARPTANNALAMMSKAHGPVSLELVTPMTVVCMVETAEEQLPCYRRTLDFAIRTLGPNNIEVSHLYNNMSGPLIANPKTRAEGCDALRKALSIADRTIEPGNVARLNTQGNLGFCLLQQLEMEESGRVLHDLLAVATSVSRARSFGSNYLGLWWRTKGQLGKAAEYFRTALSDGRALFGETHLAVYTAWTNLGAILARTDPEKAVGEMEAVSNVWASKGETMPFDEADLRRGEALLALRRTAEAKKAFAAAIALNEDLKNPPDKRSAAAIGLGRVALAEGRREEAIMWMEKAFAARAGDDVEPRLRGQAGLMLAVALTTGTPDARERARACELVRQAIVELGDTDQWYRDEQSRARTLLRKLRRTGSCQARA